MIVARAWLYARSLALLEESRLSQEVFVEALIEVFLSYTHEDEELAQQFKILRTWRQKRKRRNPLKGRAF